MIACSGIRLPLLCITFGNYQYVADHPRDAQGCILNAMPLAGILVLFNIAEGGSRHRKERRV